MRAIVETTRERGLWAERRAAEHLGHHGLREIERNYRCPCGEIDLIMQHGATVVFVEVRYRSDSRFGSAAETINFPKRKRLLKTAQHYLQAHPWAADAPCRFDVVVITGAPHRPRIEWIVEAFHA